MYGLPKNDLQQKGYQYRRQTCLKAKPNEGHFALVNLEKSFREKNRKFHLITQNVDGLHRRAGQSEDVTFEIHGNINFMRDANDVDNKLYPIPEDAQLSDGVLLLPNGKLARPHVLWFDECYNEELYRFESALKVARKMDGLLFVGTTLQTNLPSQIVSLAVVSRL
jgi:NAD-dependent deacetylase